MFLPSPVERKRKLKNGKPNCESIISRAARDEARHGKAFEGLLKRYFGK